MHSYVGLHQPHVEARGKEKGEEQEPHAPRDARALAHHHHAVEGVFQRDGAALEIVCDLVVEFHGLVDFRAHAHAEVLERRHLVAHQVHFVVVLALERQQKRLVVLGRRRWPRLVGRAHSCGRSAARRARIRPE